MIRVLISFLILISSFAFSSENSCEVKGYDIGFFNGVKTPYDNAILGLDNIISLLNIKNYNGEIVDYNIFYNDSRVDETDLYLMVDLAETFDQRTNELNIQADEKWEAFWEIISEHKSSGVLGRVYKSYPKLLSYVNNELSAYINERIRNFLYELSGRFGLGMPNMEEVAKRHRLINDAITWQGKKIIYIAHSQGDLWANQSYNRVVQQKGYSENSVKIIHIAPASTQVNGDYILSSNDIVINGLRAIIGNVMWPNTTAQKSEEDYLGHGLSEVYLKDPETKNKIISAINNAFTSLLPPHIEDYLFEITYEYTPNFVSTHDIPEIKIVDNIKDPSSLGWWVDYYYLNYINEDHYELRSAPGIETILLDIDNNSRNRSVVTVTQCNDISTEDYFIIGEYSRAENGLVSMWPYLPPDIETHFLVKDRYGEVLLEDNISYNENRDKGWRYDASVIGFRVENPYSDEELNYLESKNLDIKYNMYSDFIGFLIQS